MTSWLIGIVTGIIYDFIGIAARLKSADEPRRLKARLRGPRWKAWSGACRSAPPRCSSGAREPGWRDFAHSAASNRTEPDVHTKGG
jgi:hypothetical protein